MRKIRLDIGGPKGNALIIMGTVEKLLRMMGDDDPKGNAKLIVAEMKGDVFRKLGGQGNDYEGLLWVYKKHFPFVELYATHDIGIDPELYTLDEDPEIYEL
jgi:hypothetical protein